jgi:hypothetical protein
LALTIFGSGLSGLLGKPFVSVPAEGFVPIAVPWFADVPLLGRVFFQHDPLVYYAYLLVPALWLLLYRTRVGRKISAVGDTPATADAMGISVAAVRYSCVLAGGLAAGLGGAYLSLAYTQIWVDNMTAGRGWIALAMVIFGAWDPVRTASDSPAPVQTAERRGAYGVGYNSDASTFAPEKHLVSAIWNWGPYYVEAVKQVRAGAWKSTDEWWPIGTDIVGLSPFGPAVSSAIKSLVEQRKADLMAGRFDVFWGPIKDQSGKLRIAVDERPPDTDLLRMDWFVEGVVGTVP